MAAVALENLTYFNDIETITEDAKHLDPYKNGISVDDSVFSASHIIHNGRTYKKYGLLRIPSYYFLENDGKFTIKRLYEYDGIPHKIYDSYYLIRRDTNTYASRTFPRFILKIVCNVFCSEFELCALEHIIDNKALRHEAMHTMAVGSVSAAHFKNDIIRSAYTDLCLSDSIKTRRFNLETNTFTTEIIDSTNPIMSRIGCSILGELREELRVYPSDIANITIKPTTAVTLNSSMGTTPDNEPVYTVYLFADCHVKYTNIMEYLDILNSRYVADESFALDSGISPYFINKYLETREPDILDKSKLSYNATNARILDRFANNGEDVIDMMAGKTTYTIRDITKPNARVSSQGYIGNGGKTKKALKKRTKKYSRKN